MLANPYGVPTPIAGNVTKPNPRAPGEKDKVESTVKAPDRAAGRPPEPHWDPVISAATD
jgi:hypothetical protein